MPERRDFYVNKGSTFVFDMLGDTSDELLYGWSVTASTQEENGKIFCKTDYGYCGYVDVNDISQGEYMPTHRVSSLFCDVLESAKYSGVPIDTLPMGSLVRVTEEKSKFSIIEYNSRRLYVPTAHLERLSDAPVTPSRIIACAKRYLGAPYRWGGKTPQGVDCSGLCFMAYYLNGVKIYRDARFPFYSDYEIPTEKLRPADLVFFKGHVALYIGNDEIIHSKSADGKTVVSPLDRSKVIACASLYDIM